MSLHILGQLIVGLVFGWVLGKSHKLNNPMVWLYFFIFVVGTYLAAIN